MKDEPGILLVLGLGLGLAASPLCAQDAEAGEKGRPDIEALRELANPGPEHELLDKFKGKWKVKVEMGRGGRTAPSNGNGNSYMTMEKRFLWLGYDTRGRAGNFKGAFLIGFDRRHEHFTIIALDTTGTYFVTSQGKEDPGSGKIKLYGKDDDPHMKAMGFEKEFVHVLDLEDPEKLTIEVYFIDTRTPARKETMAMEFVFERKK